MAEKKIVLFDIDHTLFDATLYRDRMFDLIETGIEFENREKLREVLEKQYVEHRKKIGYFDAKFMLQEIITELNVEADAMKIFQAILADEVSYREALFEETIEVLEELSKHKHIEMGIFSSGRRDHQLKKIALFRHLFHDKHIHIMAFKDKELPKVMKNYKIHTELYLIDDILPLLEIAKKVRKEMITIWMKRGHYAEQQKEQTKFRPDFTVENLREVLPILSQKSKVKNQK